MKKGEEEEKEEVVKTEILIARPAGLYALRQFGQNLINAVNQYEEDVKKELVKEDGK